MRHSNIQTTIKNYQGRTPERVGMRLYRDKDDLETVLEIVRKITDSSQRNELFNLIKAALDSAGQNVTFHVPPTSEGCGEGTSPKP